MDWDVDVLTWIGGEPGRTAWAVEETLERLRERLPEAFVTFLVDGPGWDGLLGRWLPRFPRRREIRLRKASDLPQILYNRGAETSSLPWLAFLWPGCGVSAAAFNALRAAAEGAELIYGDSAGPVPEGLFHPVQHGWLQMADLVPMHNALLSRRAFEAAGRFDPSPLLKRFFWWDLTLRLSRGGRLGYVPAAPASMAWEWRDFPSLSPGPDPDLAARYVAGSREKERVFLKKVFSPRRPLKITLLSGLHDAHQNQLFFYSFFDRVAGRGVLTWRTVLYERCRPEELAKCDLAIFSRPRFPEVPALLDACRANGVPVMVMIDDNWIAAGREFPRFERLFTPGKPPFEVFLDSLRRADAVLVFNPVLEEDVRPFAQRVLRLPASIDLSFFKAPEEPRKPGFLVGFAGSPRWEETGFRGLARFLEHHPETRLLVMAHEVPEPLREVPPERLTFVPWRYDYEAYARTLASMRPDVLVAPLDASRFSASKIPVKLLESAAVGAAGVYSRVPPYTEHVRDGETGLLVENREEAWEAALERLHRHPDLRRRIAERALAEVRERFTTERVLPAFLDALRGGPAARPAGPARYPAG